ncbi:MAG TPA: lysophospholipid acyltransferase family protein [Kofleriaceae bacterium]|nr:lysophospholipid acyltransferase family protein [Kofleriaceae bacterium]
MSSSDDHPSGNGHSATEHPDVPDAVVPDAAADLELGALRVGADEIVDVDDPYDDPQSDPEADGGADSNDWGGDDFLGGEAAVPPGDYGPPIASNLPDRELITSELRELERRVRARLTPMFPMEQRRRLPLAFLWKRYRHLAMRDRSDYVDEFGRDPMYSARVEPLLAFLYNQYFRVEARGVENVPAEGPVLLVANHSGTLPYDGAILMQSVRSEHPNARDVRPLVEDFVFHFPYLGTFINRIGGVRACQENATRLLEDDQVVAVFPEGVKGIGKLYKDRYKLQRFGRGGFVKLALRTGAPIVPVSIVGAEEIHPMVGKVSWLAKTLGVPYLPITPTFPWLGPLGLLPLPSKWLVRFDPPIDLAAEYSVEAADDRILVNRLSESVRSRIQTMIEESLRERRSVLRG